MTDIISVLPFDLLIFLFPQYGNLGLALLRLPRLLRVLHMLSDFAFLESAVEESHIHVSPSVFRVLRLFTVVVIVTNFFATSKSSMMMMMVVVTWAGRVSIKMRMIVWFLSLSVVISVAVCFSYSSSLSVFFFFALFAPFFSFLFFSFLFFSFLFFSFLFFSFLFFSFQFF